MNKAYRDWFVCEPGAPLQECYIAPFSHTQKERYLEEYSRQNPSPNEWQGKTYLEQLEALPSLYQLVNNPLLLHMVVRVLPRLVSHPVKQASSTRADVYAAFIADWFERQAQRLLQQDIASLIWKGSSQPSADAFAAFCDELALQMFFATAAEAQLSVKYQPKPARISKYAQAKPAVEADAWGQFLNNSDADVVRIRSGCPLRCVDGEYAFYHKSFLEYFIALALYKDVGFDQADEDCFEDALASLSQTEWNKKHVTHEPAVVDFLVEMMQRRQSSIAKKLFAMVRASCQNEAVALASSNAISVMNAMRIPFIDDYSDLSDVYIPGADLSYALLDHANLNRAHMRGVKLSQAFLRYADLRGADLEAATFGERPYIECDGQIHAICFAPDGKMMAVGVDSTIELRTLEGERIALFTGHASRVNSVAFSGQGDVLASGSMIARSDCGR